MPIACESIFQQADSHFLCNIRISTHLNVLLLSVVFNVEIIEYTIITFNNIKRLNTVNILKYKSVNKSLHKIFKVI